MSNSPPSFHSLKPHLSDIALPLERHLSVPAAPVLRLLASVAALPSANVMEHFPCIPTLHLQPHASDGEAAVALRAVQPLRSLTGNGSSYAPLPLTASVADWLTASGLAGEVTVHCCAAAAHRETTLVALLKGQSSNARCLCCHPSSACQGHHRRCCHSACASSLCSSPSLSLPLCPCDVLSLLCCCSQPYWTERQLPAACKVPSLLLLVTVSQCCSISYSLTRQLPLPPARVSVWPVGVSSEAAVMDLLDAGYSKVIVATPCTAAGRDSSSDNSHTGEEDSCDECQTQTGSRKHGSPLD